MKQAFKRRWVKVLLVILAILVLLAGAMMVLMAKNNGTFAAGNAKEYSVASTEALSGSPLEGKTIIFLGSSVTYGSAAKGESFADYLEKRDGIIPVKEAVSGTTLVDEDSIMGPSYIARMQTIDPNIQADAFVCQLSTNDATGGKPMGQISAGMDRADLDTKTVAGAIEYVISYATETWDCPVIFFTGTKYDSPAYGEMVDLLLQIQEKWGIGVIDLWNDPGMNAVSAADYQLYMVNGIHPSRAGYQLWWTPFFETYLTGFLAS